MGRAVGVVLMIASLGALILAATGGAALKTKSASTHLDPSEEGSVTAKCKRGTEAVSGGFETTEEGRIRGAARAGKRQWTVTGLGGGIDGVPMTAFAYCDRSEPKLKKQSTEVSVDSSDVRAAATATCKRGTEAVSGGFEGDSELVVVAAQRDGKRRWTAAALELLPVGQTRTFTAFVYCDKSKPGLKVRSSTTEIDSFGLGSATTECGRRTKLVSGGFSSPPVMASGFPGPAVIVHESHREGARGWTASGLAGFGGGSLAVYAYCEKKQKKK
jgi:hypothetical protein